jgi:hypothetical protein
LFCLNGQKIFFFFFLWCGGNLTCLIDPRSSARRPSTQIVKWVLSVLFLSRCLPPRFNHHPRHTNTNHNHQKVEATPKPSSNYSKNCAGEFACVVHNPVTGEFLAARDLVGVASLYLGYMDDGAMVIASETTCGELTIARSKRRLWLKCRNVAQSTGRVIA